MTAKPPPARRENAAIVRVGAAACAARFALSGVTGLDIAAIVGVVVDRHRRTRTASCAPAPITTAVAAPTLRSRR